MNRYLSRNPGLGATGLELLCTVRSVIAKKKGRYERVLYQEHGVGPFHVKRGLRLEYLLLLDQGAAPAAADCAAVNAWLFRQPVALPAVARHCVASEVK